MSTKIILWKFAKVFSILLLILIGIPFGFIWEGLVVGFYAGKSGVTSIAKECTKDIEEKNKKKVDIK